ncbi:MFS transporter [Paraburkholderia antibiotica]|uniref:MFS transporter n=1 Tax=Paraburkholderia antibiotica TaxID=2728839 RepID=A0A7Y0A103_9BURK|nr:MFS transporter [Paraburkholderia antibiotica]NML34492.1 MFS transporter [Paraburkholderia antibiotica]
MQTEVDVMRKVVWHIVPLIFVLFILNSIDRVNVSFAALQMNAELGFTPRVYGFGVGMFFVSYLLFQIPIAFAARRYGVRVCLGLMSIAWGLAAAGMSLVHTPTQFYALRFLLGVTEAGFAPVTLYYYSVWIPAQYRARVTSKNTIAIAVSIVIGAPLSGWLMTSTHTLGGLSGWRWMFVAEGVVPVLLGLYTLLRLPETPHDAAWLGADERALLLARLDADAGAHTTHAGSAARVSALPRTAGSLRLWACAGAWFALTMGVYGIIFWLPQAIKHLSHFGDFTVAVLAATPWVFAGVAMWLNALHSDRRTERLWHVVLPTLVGAFGLAASVVAGAGASAYAMLLVGLIGLGAAQAVFWAVPMDFLKGAAAAGGFALINLCGNLAGLIGPNVIGWIRQTTGSFENVAYFLAAVLLLGALLLALALRPRGAAGEMNGDGRSARVGNSD